MIIAQLFTENILAMIRIFLSGASGSIIVIMALMTKTSIIWMSC